MIISKEGTHTYKNGKKKGFWMEFSHQNKNYYASAVRAKGDDSSEAIIAEGCKSCLVGEYLELQKGVEVSRKMLLECVRNFCKKLGGLDEEWDEE